MRGGGGKGGKRDGGEGDEGSGGKKGREGGEGGMGDGSKGAWGTEARGNGGGRKGQHMHRVLKKTQWVLEMGILLGRREAQEK